MAPIHEGLEYKAFPTPTIGAPTGIFGDMSEPEDEPEDAPETQDEPDAPADPLTAVQQALQGLLQ